MKKILVTGGAGFIGSNLCEKLVQNSKNSVYSLDNYFTGKKENHVKGVTYIEGETRHISDLINFSPDIVYHLGEYSRVEQSFDDIDKVWEYNMVSIFYVLEFCRKTDSKIIYSGSSTKFGDGGQSRFESPYAWTKSSNTEFVESYSSWFGLKYAITYFYNVYGNKEISNGKYATLIALFKEKYRKGEPLTVVSPGSQKRNFTHIDDVIEALILIGHNSIGNNFGIGSKESFSVLEIAKMFESEIEMVPERAGNRMTADLMTSKTEALGWKANRSIKDYIKQIIK